MKIRPVLLPLAAAALALFVTNIYQRVIWKGMSSTANAPPWAPVLQLGPVSLKSAYFGSPPPSVTDGERGWLTAEVPWHNTKWQQRFGSLRIRALRTPLDVFPNRRNLCKQILETFGARDGLVGKPDISRIAGNCATKGGKLAYQFIMIKPRCGLAGLAVALVPEETKYNFQESTDATLAPDELCRAEARGASWLWIGLLFAVGTTGVLVAYRVMRHVCAN